jgi:hypothetical protein
VKVKCRHTPGLVSCLALRVVTVAVVYLIKANDIG